MTDKLLNLGCGARFHPAWTNVDLASADPRVLEHDIRRPLPFDDGTFEAVYHSHVLEHLPPDDGRALLAECFRVLRPGGIVRVVVPDLESIARQYLATLERAAEGDVAAHADHHWMTIEMLDQLVRGESGGQMKHWLCDPRIPNRPFVEERVGSELANMAGTVTARPATKKRNPFRSPVGRLRRFIGRVRKDLSRTARSVLAGPQADAAYREAAFRQSGEVHRWMYDRVSLSRVLEEAGFQAMTVATAISSRIARFADYELDSVGGRVRKPDSLFVEAVKPEV